MAATAFEKMDMRSLRVSGALGAGGGRGVSDSLATLRVALGGVFCAGEAGCASLIEI